MRSATLCFGFLLTLLAIPGLAAAKMDYAALAVVPKHGKQFPVECAFSASGPNCQSITV